MYSVYEVKYVCSVYILVYRFIYFIYTSSFGVLYIYMCTHFIYSSFFSVYIYVFISSIVHLLVVEIYGKNSPDTFCV